MSIIIRKKLSEVNFKQAVLKKENLPKENNFVRDVRYVKMENNFYIFSGFNWQELDLVIGE